MGGVILQQTRDIQIHVQKSNTCMSANISHPARQPFAPQTFQRANDKMDETRAVTTMYQQLNVHEE